MLSHACLAANPGKRRGRGGPETASPPFPASPGPHYGLTAARRGTRPRPGPAVPSPRIYLDFLPLMHSEPCLAENQGKPSRRGQTSIPAVNSFNVTLHGLRPSQPCQPSGSTSRPRAGVGRGVGGGSAQLVTDHPLPIYTFHHEPSPNGPVLDLRRKRHAQARNPTRSR